VKQGAVIYDVFAGVGPFALLAKKKFKAQVGNFGFYVTIFVLNFLRCLQTT
jgi:hypothetical protein